MQHTLRQRRGCGERICRKPLSAILSLMFILAAATGACSQEHADSLISAEPLSIEQFRTLFNKDTGTPRLVLLTTPT